MTVLKPKKRALKPKPSDESSVRKKKEKKEEEEEMEVEGKDGSLEASASTTQVASLGAKDGSCAASASATQVEKDEGKNGSLEVSARTTQVAALAALAKDGSLEASASVLQANKEQEGGRAGDDFAPWTKSWEDKQAAEGKACNATEHAPPWRSPLRLRSRSRSPTPVPQPTDSDADADSDATEPTGNDDAEDAADSGEAGDATAKAEHGAATESCYKRKDIAPSSRSRLRIRPSSAPQRHLRALEDMHAFENARLLHWRNKLREGRDKETDHCETATMFVKLDRYFAEWALEEEKMHLVQDFLPEGRY